MSSIHSNSLGDADLSDFQPTDQRQKVLQTLLSIPIKPATQLSHLLQTHPTQPHHNYNHIRKKLHLFIKCLLNNVQYKNQLKSLTQNLSQVDKMKSANGMCSYQKDIVKYSVVLKHHEIQECRQLFSGLVCKVVIGDQ